MPFFLKHNFNPDFDYTNLVPTEIKGRRVDHFNLGYVQNVEAGTELARWVKVDPVQAQSLDPRFVFEERIFPAGQNTEVDPDNPDRLLAKVNGYVYYFENTITVKSVLNVRRDIDYHTGNVEFKGDLVVHGSVRTGFSIQGHNIIVKGHIEGAHVRAMGSLIAESGVKGAHRGYLHSHDNMRLKFVENCKMRIGRNLLVQGAALHSNIYCGGRILVDGRLTGGSICCRRRIFVSDVIGGGIDTATEVILGYDPNLLRQDAIITGRINTLREEWKKLENLEKKTDGPRVALYHKREQISNVIAALQKKRREISDRNQALEQLEECRLVVPGEVRPGLEISIGQAYLKVQDFMHDVYFYYKDHQILVGSPAPKQW